MKAAIAGDGPASSGPHTNHPKERDVRFIPGERPGDHKLLFGWFGARETKRTRERRDRQTGTAQRFGWDHGLPPSDTDFGLKANMLTYGETDTKGKTRKFPWTADLPQSRETVTPVMRTARRGWAIGNGTFRTLKARDAYRFGHSFGHGNNHPADVFATPATPAFPIDRVRRHCCPLFRKAWEYRGRNLCFRDRMRELFGTFAFPDWKIFCRAITGEPGREDCAGPVRAGPQPFQSRPDNPVFALRRMIVKPGRPRLPVVGAQNSQSMSTARNDRWETGVQATGIAARDKHGVESDRFRCDNSCNRD